MTLKQPACRYASRRGTQCRNQRGNTLIGLFIGLVLGVLIAAGIALYFSKSPFPFTQKERERSQKQDRQATAPKPAEVAKARPGPENLGTPKDSGVKSDTAKPELAKPDASKSDDAKSDRAKPETAKTEIAKADPKAANESFLLQAGSFANPADADNQKAKLALIGLDAFIEPADLPDKGVWYRVRLGPYKSLGEVNAVRSQLATNGIDVTLLRRANN